MTHSTAGQTFTVDAAEERNLPDWRKSLAAAIRDPEELLRRLNLPLTSLESLRRGAESFPLLVPESYLRRMRPGDPRDPLLLQVLPGEQELQQHPGFIDDPVGDAQAERTPGILTKYSGRALLVVTGACAVHCRYCFRRYFPYEDGPHSLADWTDAMRSLHDEPDLSEVILSGGDPLTLSDRKLDELIARIEAIPQVTRLRIHTRLPIVLPDRVTDGLLHLLRNSRLQPIVIVHANHPAEIQGDCAVALLRLVQAGLPTLNQAVLLRAINDDIETLEELSLRLINLGVMPYYLHQLDRVRGAHHFEVPPDRGRELVQALRDRLPGYAVPRYVQEIAGKNSKQPLL